VKRIYRLIQLLVLLATTTQLAAAEKKSHELPWSSENVAKNGIIELIVELSLCNDKSRFSCPSFNPGAAMGVLIKDVLGARKNDTARRNMVSLVDYYLGEGIYTELNCAILRQGKPILPFVDEKMKMEKNECELKASSYADPRSTERITKDICQSNEQAKARLIILRKSLISGERCEE
jgi:hypothetical protein